jgi:DNA-binding HxlR family transcriptional regulator
MTKLTPVTATPPPSALEGALARIGDRWSLLVVEALLEGPQRFAELERALPGIATNILTQRLKRLAADNLVLAVPYSTRPPRFAYQLTDAGAGLAGTLRLLAQWSADHASAGSVHTPEHSACGTPLEARWWCPTCDQIIEEEPPDLRWL